MRIFIRNNHPFIIKYLEKYLSHYLLNKNVNLIINGERFDNREIISLEIVEGDEKTESDFKTTSNENFYVLKVRSKDETFNIPISIERTKVDLLINSFLFQMKDYHSLIEIVGAE